MDGERDGEGAYDMKPGCFKTHGVEVAWLDRKSSVHTGPLPRLAQAANEARSSRSRLPGRTHTQPWSRGHYYGGR